MEVSVVGSPGPHILSLWTVKIHTKYINKYDLVIAYPAEVAIRVPYSG